ncbi:hypothetical protein GCM10009552_32720 [Rothia nasimurium]
MPQLHGRTIVMQLQQLLVGLQLLRRLVGLGVHGRSLLDGRLILRGRTGCEGENGEERSDTAHEEAIPGKRVPKLRPGAAHLARQA